MTINKLLFITWLLIELFTGWMIVSVLSALKNDPNSGVLVFGLVLLVPAFLGILISLPLIILIDKRAKRKIAAQSWQQQQAGLHKDKRFLNWTFSLMILLVVGLVVWAHIADAMR